MHRVRFSCSQRMTDDTGRAFAAAVERNTSLQHVTFSRQNSLWDMTDDTGRALAAAVERNSSLRHVAFSTGGVMSDDTGRVLAAAVERNSNLWHVGFSYEVLEESDNCRMIAQALAAVIMRSSTLRGVSVFPRTVVRGVY